MLRIKRGGYGAGVLMVMAGLMLGGCGSPQTEKTAETTENGVSGWEAVDTDKEKKGEAVQTAKEDASGETLETQAQENPVTGETGEASDPRALYEAFIKGEAKATFKATNDRAAGLVLSNVLKEGEEYTVSDIEDLLPGVDEYMEIQKTENPSFRYIDCGRDGREELLMQMDYDAFYGGEHYTLYTLIKEYDGILTIIYDEDMWSRKNLEIYEDGSIISGGSNGAAAHVYEEAFVDADGIYHYCYGTEETGMPYSYYVYRGEEYTELDFSELDPEHLMINSYWFDPEYEGREYFYTFSVLDDDWRDITLDEDFDTDSPYMKKFAEAGVKVYTHEQIDEILQKRDAQLGR